MAGVIQYGNEKYYIRMDSFVKSPMALRSETRTESGGVASTRRITFNQGNWAKFNLQMPKNCSFVDVERCQGVEEFLQNTGLAKPLLINGNEVVRNVNDKWYPLYKFNEDMLKQLDPGGYMRYSQKYDKQLEIEALRYGMASQRMNFPDTGKVEIDCHQL